MHVTKPLTTTDIQCGMFIYSWGLWDGDAEDWDCFEALRMILPFTLTLPTFSFEQASAQQTENCK